MKLLKFIYVALLATVLTSCSKNYNYNIHIEKVEVKFNSQELLKAVTTGFDKTASVKTNTLTSPPSSTYEHQFPSTYKAYFISKESRGEYTEGQIVDSIDVVPGMNTITIPKLNYDVYVTNYKHAQPKWYTWPDAIQQLPQSSTKLYLYGKNNIDYRTLTEGTVELTNPYAAVMIKKNQWLNGIPTHNVGNKEYTLVDNNGWYLLYIRNNTSNTKIPVSIPGYSSDNYQLNKTIEANKIYQYTIDGSIPNIIGGNFMVSVIPFERTITEVIKL